MKSKKIKVVLSISMIILVACAGFYVWDSNIPIKNVARSEASYILHDNLTNLEEKCDLIIICRPKKEIYDEKSTIEDDKGNIYSSFEEIFEKNFPQYDYYTMRSVNVNKVLKGSFDAKTIQVYEHAVVVNKVLYTYQDNTVLLKDKKYLLFLTKTTKGYSMNAIQGKINLDDTDKDEKEITKNIEKFTKVKNEVLTKYKDDIKNTP